MPSKTRDKDRDHDADTSKLRGKRHRRSSRKSSSKDPDKASNTPERRDSHASPSAKRTASMPIPELERRATSNSPHGSRSNLPYPSFSKAHSKEAVGSRENVVNKRMSCYTPDPTDLDRTQAESDNGGKPNTTGAPPSPPLTTVEQASEDQKAAKPPVVEEDQRRASPATVKDDRKRPSSKVDKEDRTVRVERKRTDLQKNAEELKRRLQGRSSALSGKSDRRSPPLKSRNSQREPKDAEGSSSTVRSKLDPRPKPEPSPVMVETASSTTCPKPSSLAGSSTTENETTTESTIDSDATSIAPNQLHLQPPSIPPRENRSPTTDPKSPRKPTHSEPNLPSSRRQTPAIVNGDHAIPGPFDDSPAPLPPPPPPAVPFQMPRVDYLMQNGGLSQSIPRTLLGAGQPVQAPAQPASAQVVRFFAPFHNLLDDYTKVIARSGSLAVATGYRSIARRLLDRLEAVFARDISSETCTCIICESSPLTDEDLQNEQGVSWGEILEYVCGRQELPQWPPFVLNSVQGGLGISGENKKPMQHLDIDVPEEFRDHYVRQSKKTKQSVDEWLDSQPDSPTSAPTDVDDETLTFAMLTRLEPEQRPIFSSLVGVAPSRPPSRASTSLMSPRSSLLETTGLAIQRLYRLIDPPRDPESAIYLLTNPALHNILATLAAISDHEWEILTSGRFDGFLRSGAEDHPNPISQSHPPSRGPTPARIAPSVPSSGRPTPFSRSQTPASGSVGAPVALDEETEIAVLAEVELEIFHGMEALEDAFEALHGKAENVRRALRERGAGLSVASQSRRGPGNLDARLGTPADGTSPGGGGYGWESETDDGIEDGMSELAPDDSASNVSRSRTRRPKRRTERRTPAPVEEEDEGSEED